MFEAELAALLNGRLAVDGAGTYRVAVQAQSLPSQHGDDWWLTRCSVTILVAAAVGELALARVTSAPVIEGQTEDGWRSVFDDEGTWHDLLEDACRHAQATLILLGSITQLTLLGVCDVDVPALDPLAEPTPTLPAMSSPTTNGPAEISISRPASRTSS